MRKKPVPGGIPILDNEQNRGSAATQDNAAESKTVPAETSANTAYTSAAVSPAGAGGGAAPEAGFPTVDLSLKLFLIGIFMLLITVPLLTLLIFGSSETALESEKESTLSAPTPGSWLDGSFQSSLESWFSTHYPSRSDLVVFYRQLKFDADSLNIINISSAPDETETTELIKSDDEVWQYMFDTENNIYALANIRRRDEPPVEPTGFKGSDAVLVGKSGYLFESAYIDEYYGYSEPYNTVTDDGLVTLVDMLEYIQGQLAKRGITMVYLLSSSKAGQYSEYIPEWYKNTKYAPAGYVRPYVRLQKLLAESTVNYVDSSALFKQIGLYATFPKTGIHWNHLSSFEATRAVLDKYAELTGVNVRRMGTNGVIETDAPPSIGGNSDVDIYNILYGAIDKSGSVTDEAYYAPDGYVVNPDDGEKIGVLIQGGSFSGDVVNYLRKYRIVDEFEQFSYNSYTGQAKYSPFGKMGYDAWDILLEDIDLVIFEQTEQQIRGEFPTRDNYVEAAGNWYIGSNVIYSTLYYYLQDNEIQ